MSAKLNQPCQRLPMPRLSRAAGFTLIEILIVVVILGILSAILVPQLSSASREARETMLRDDIRSLRNQMAMFRLQHREVPAGFPDGDLSALPDEATLIDHLTLFTDDQCATSTSASSIYRFGPYMSKIPDNPLSEKNGILVVAPGSAMPSPDESQPYGWIYSPSTQKLIANLSGTDLRNIAYTEY